jgi:hypothetical protein
MPRCVVLSLPPIHQSRSTFASTRSHNFQSSRSCDLIRLFPRILPCLPVSRQSSHHFRLTTISKERLPTPLDQKHPCPVRMKTTALTFLSVVGSVAAQGVAEQISPSSPPPPGCTESFDGNFEVQIRNPLAKRGPAIEVCSGTSPP